MKSNIDKCQLIISTNDIAEIQIGDFSIKIRSSEKLLGVNIDSKLNIDSYIKHLCSKSSKKLRVVPCMTLEKNIIVMNSFFNAQLNHFPLFGCFKKSKIKLVKDNSVSLHRKNLSKHKQMKCLK